MMLEDGFLCASCSSARICTLVEDMESGATALHDFRALFLWDAWRLGQDHGESSLMSLELDVMPCLEEDSTVVFLLFNEGPNACFDVRVEDLGFEDSNSRMGM